MCCHQEWFEGYRSGPSDYLPASSWGCYFPGDEPGYKCALTGDYCPREDDNPFECDCIEDTEILCPDCLEYALENPDEENEPIYLQKNGEGVLLCNCCGEHFNKDEITKKLIELDRNKTN